jgi:putative acetyltransferase
LRTLCTVRPEQPNDLDKIRKINQAAFGRPDEAGLVDALRDDGVVLLSLVAETGGGNIAGHILFSRMAIDTPKGPLEAVSLAPMAVRPDYQRTGIGAQLIEAGLAQLRHQGERIVIVLGHPLYYPRFGFTTEKTSYLTSPFPPEAFMALELIEGSLTGVHGAVRYPHAFGL